MKRFPAAIGIPNPLPKLPVPWVTNFQPNVDAYRAALVSAMNQYDADQSDANWELVKTAFVDGWATQYAAANG